MPIGKKSHTFKNPEVYNTRAKAKKDILGHMNDAHVSVSTATQIGVLSGFLNKSELRKFETIMLKLYKFYDKIEKKKV